MKSPETDIVITGLEGDALFAVLFCFGWMGAIYGAMAIKSHINTKKGLDWFGDPLDKSKQEVTD